MEVNPAEIARNRRWLSLLAGVGLMGASGGIYLFSSYSAALSEHLDINNTELSLIGAAGNIGQWCGVHLGFAVDRWGPVRCSLGGALAAGFGFLCMGLAVDGVLPGNYLVFALYNFVLALFVLLFLAFPLLWFVVWPRFLATDTEPDEAAVPQTPAKVWEPPQWAASVDRAGLLPDSSPVPHAPQLQYAATDEARQVSQVSTLAAAPRPEMTPAPVAAGPPSFAASVLTVDFALLFVGMGGIIGWATTLLNNLAPLTASLLSVHKDEHWTKEGSDNKHFEQRLGSFVTLVSTANVVGRLTLGYLADRYQHRVPRVAWLATAGTILLFACVLQLVAMDTAALYLVVPITGVGLGAVFSTAPVVLSDIASVEHLAQLWGLLTCGACATTLLFATFLAGHFANDAADDSSFTIHTRKFCLGERCFRYGIAAVCGCCTVGTLALWALTYRRLQHRKRALSPAL